MENNVSYQKDQQMNSKTDITTLSLRKRFDLFRQWQWFEAFGLTVPSIRIRWYLFSMLSAAVIGEWIGIMGFLINEDLPSTTWMVTVTNCGFVPMIVYCLYYIVVTGSRPDLIVEAGFAMLASNASLFYHFCAIPQQLDFCTDSDQGRDEEIYDDLMHHDFAVSYFMFAVALLVVTDIQDLFLKCSIYGTTYYLCWKAMETRNNRSGEVDAEEFQAAILLSFGLFVCRLLHVLWTVRQQLPASDLSNRLPRTIRALFQVVRFFSPVPFVLGSLFLTFGMLCNKKWTDNSASEGDSSYTTPHGFWHLLTQGSAVFVVWIAVDFSARWRDVAENGFDSSRDVDTDAADSKKNASVTSSSVDVEMQAAAIRGGE